MSIGWLFSKYKLYALGLLAFVLALVGIRAKIIDNAQERQRNKIIAKEQKRYKGTRDRIDASRSPSDADDARDWLRDFSGQDDPE